MTIETAFEPQSSVAAVGHSEVRDVAQLRQAVAEVVPQLRDHAIAVDRDGAYPHTSIEHVYRAGLLGIGLGVTHRGMGFGTHTAFGHYFDTLIDLASGCSSTAQVFAVQTGALFTLDLLGSAAQLAPVAHAVHTRAATFCYVGAEPDERFTPDGKRVNLKSVAKRTDRGWLIKAEKAFATGSVGAQYALFQCAVDAPEGGSLLVFLERSHPAVEVIDSWDAVGQRGTSSGRLLVATTEVGDDAVLGDPAGTPRAAILAPLFQLGFASLLTGIAQGALDFSVDYVRHRKAPTVGFESAGHEPAIQGHIADMQIDVSAARAMIARAAALMDRFTAGEDVISEVLSAVYQAKVHASRISVEVSSRLFQVAGARVSHSSFDADRFWRCARTLTLHDSVDKQKGIVGRHVLGVEKPAVSMR